jgi:hypothetical protein
MTDAMSRGIPFIILENPVWHNGDKPATYTWAYNGLNGLGWVPRPPAAVRIKPPLQDWKEWWTGQQTIFGQVNNDKALRGLDIDAWVYHVQQVLPEAIFRKHPVMRDRLEPVLEPFERCIAKTSLAITYSSTVGAEAVIAGIPTIAISKGSLAYDVATHDLQAACISPDREEWLHRLSYRHLYADARVGAMREYILGGYDEALQMAAKGEYDNMSNGRFQ